MGEVVTVLLNSVPDPQRGTILPADAELVADLAASVRGHGHHLTVLSDCLPADDAMAHVTIVRAARGPNPYFHRWACIADHLARVDHDRVWCVDATDVEMLHDPFEQMGDVLHLGSEPSTVGSPWMRKTNPDLARWIDDNADRPLLNPGLVGGPTETVRSFALAVAHHWPSRDLTDMAAANRVAYGAEGGFVTGPAVHTPYKSFTRTGAWWKHK